MHIQGSRVAVIGGSIAGCASAIALTRAGCEVTVFEKSKGGLRDRGAGITVAAPVYDELIGSGYLFPEMRVGRRGELIWITREEDVPDGRIVGRQPYSSVMCSWALVWRELRDRVPAADYREGTAITGVRQLDDGVELEIEGGPTERYDAVVGADGYRSRVRSIVAPEATLGYAGYGLWRGDYPADRLAADQMPELGEDFVAVAYSGGHLVFYQIPDPASGGLRQNWALYGGVPDRLFSSDLQPIPRGRLSADAFEYLKGFVAWHLPPAWSRLVRETDLDELSVSPIYDTPVSHYVSGRLLLVGDAGTIARPHTGAGAVKALQDAGALERVCREHGTWEEALAAYDAARLDSGNALVELGKHLGRMRVETPQDWRAMTSEGFESWLHANTNGWRSAYDPTS